MNLYIKTLGFQDINSVTEQKLIQAGIKESIAEGLIIRQKELNRGVIILKISQSSGLYIYGRFENEEFIYEYYYPFVVGKRLSDNDELNIERHLDKESYAVVCDELKTGVTLIFYLQNVMDYMEYLFSKKELKVDSFDPDIKNMASKLPIKKKKVALCALSLGGMILFPVIKRKKDFRDMEEENNRRNLIQAAKNGDEEAMESLTINDLDTYSQLSQRIMKEDVFTIVDSSFMPCGVECDQYSVIGEILELSKEENVYTGEGIYIMVLECNDLIFTMAVNESCLVGEPKVGRRFKGQIWLQGSIKF